MAPGRSIIAALVVGSARSSGFTEMTEVFICQDQGVRGLPGDRPWGVRSPGAEGGGARERSGRAPGGGLPVILKEEAGAQWPHFDQQNRRVNLAKSPIMTTVRLANPPSSPT